MKITEFQWEAVAETTERMKVPGGWLVHIFGYGDALCFVADPNYQWGK